MTIPEVVRSQIPELADWSLMFKKGFEKDYNLSLEGSLYGRYLRSKEGTVLLNAEIRDNPRSKDYKKIIALDFNRFSIERTGDLVSFWAEVDRTIAMPWIYGASLEEVSDPIRDEVVVWINELRTWVK